MAGVQWAAELWEKLKASGTGQAKLDALLSAITKRHGEHPELPEDHPDRHLTALEGLAVLERAGAGSVTLDKARQFVAAGSYCPPKPADEKPPAPPPGPAPVREIPPEPGPEPADPDAPAPEVRDLSADPQTVGPKPVARAKVETGRGRRKGH